MSELFREPKYITHIHTHTHTHTNILHTRDTYAHTHLLFRMGGVVLLHPGLGLYLELLQKPTKLFCICTIKDSNVHTHCVGTYNVFIYTRGNIK